MKVIKISDDTYTQVQKLADGAGMSLADTATKLINIGLKNIKTKEKIIEKKVIVFKE